MTKWTNTNKISQSQKLFNSLTAVLVILVLFWLWVSFFTFTKNREFKNIEKTVQEKEQTLEENEASPGYKKFLAIKTLEEKNNWMYWFERIEKIYDIFEQLKNIDPEANDDIELSDFNVSLEEVSLRWTVWELKVLYFTNASWRIKALLDSFENLEFIDKMTIREYNKSEDDRFEFVLYANVIDNDWE